MGKRATAQAVAERAGVSKWTVIRAFTPGASITEASRERVLEAARALNYTPNLLARGLATNQTRQVAVLIDDFTNPHKLPFLEALTARLQAEGHVAMLINIDRNFDHMHALLTAGQRQADAIVLCGTAFREETLADHRRQAGAPPLYVLARDSQIADIPAVSCDTDHAMSAIVAHLLATGRRRPGFLAGPPTPSTGLGRQEAFAQRIDAAGFSVAATLTAARYGAAFGRAALARYLETTPAHARIDALVCENDILAVGAMAAIRTDAGLSVPDDIAVVGFDDIELAGWPEYALTTYRQPTEAIVEAAVAMIVGRSPAASLHLQGELVIRKSS